MTFRGALKNSPSVPNWLLISFSLRCSCAMRDTRLRALSEIFCAWTNPLNSSNKCSTNSQNVPTVMPCSHRHSLTLDTFPTSSAISTRPSAWTPKMQLIMFTKGTSLARESWFSGSVTAFRYIGWSLDSLSLPCLYVTHSDWKEECVLKPGYA